MDDYGSLDLLDDAFFKDETTVANIHSSDAPENDYLESQTNGTLDIFMHMLEMYQGIPLSYHIEFI